MTQQITTALTRLGQELCDDLDRVAPYMREARARFVSPAAALVSVHSERLRGSLARLSVDPTLSPALAQRIDEHVTYVVGEIRAFSEGAVPDAVRDLARKVLESAELFRSMLLRTA